MPTATSDGTRHCAYRRAKLSVRDLNFYYGKFHALKNINLDIPEKQGHGLHRPVGLRQVHPAAHLQPHVLSSTPSSAPKARSCWMARTC